jgi:arylsulfatase A-like enzyme
VFARFLAAFDIVPTWIPDSLPDRVRAGRRAPFSWAVAAAALFAPAVVLSPAAEAAAPRRPNIVLFLADDLGYGDVGCYNRDSKIPTPRLDRLAAEGIRLTDAHAPAAVCSPTRYALLTGRYAWRTRLKSGVLIPWERPLIEEGQMSLPVYLKRQGYTTACFGKWHLGWQWPTKDGQPPRSGADRLSNVDFSRPIGQGPTTRGFDRFFGVDLPNYPPYCFIEQDRTVGLPTAVNDPEFNRPGPMLPGFKQADILPEITRRAVEFVERSGPEPFFLYFPFTSPHYPVAPAADFRGKTPVGDYGDFVFQTDACVGQVLDALARKGLADNTLVIFTSDNGPEVDREVMIGAYERIRKYGHASMGPLRGVKRDCWEGGHRVPFIARWSGKIPAGATSDELICHVDLFAAIAAAVGAELPAAAAEDSVNVLPALLGAKRDQPLRDGLILHSGKGRFAVRQGDWVLIDAASGDDNRELQWFKDLRGYTDHDQPGELYNLRLDPTQGDNRYAAEPDRVREMKAYLARHKAGRGP